MGFKSVDFFDIGIDIHRYTDIERDIYRERERLGGWGRLG